MKLEELEQEIEKIKKRNAKVEIDKAWEVSKTRKVLLMVFTYLAIGLYLQAMGIEKPWLHAIVPTVGFLLSTLILPFFKNLWRKYFYR